jgi:hypothetical protein
MAGVGPRRIGAFLTSGLSRAVAEYLDETTRLQAVWHAHVPEPLASHGRPIRVAGGILTVHADTSVWANRLLQQQFTLLSCLVREPLLQHLTGLKIKVSPLPAAGSVPAPKAPPPSRHPAFSGATGRLLRSVAAGIEHPALRAAMLRLAGLSGGSGGAR